jgi:phage pi2 protein 07
MQTEKFIEKILFWKTTNSRVCIVCGKTYYPNAERKIWCNDYYCSMECCEKEYEEEALECQSH